MKRDSREVKLFGLVGNLEMSPTSQMGQLTGVGEEADPRRTKGLMGTAPMRTWHKPARRDVLLADTHASSAQLPILP